MKYLFKSKIILNRSFHPTNSMSSFQNAMTHCPKCSKPLLNGGEFLGSAEFSMRCPWCQASVLVVVQPKITASLKPLEASFKHSSQEQRNRQFKMSNVLTPDPGEMEVTRQLKSPNKEHGKKAAS